MSDEWDKLWLKKPFTLDSLLVDDEGNSLQSDHGIWLERVKVEGDLLLREKRSLLTYGGMLRDENARLEKKLEAIEKEMRFFESLEVNLEEFKAKDIVKHFRKVLGDE